MSALTGPSTDFPDPEGSENELPVLEEFNF
jgi:hypothetical protein